MQKYSTKKHLILSALSLLMCVSMLIGTTFAWFTDSVTSGKNQIIAGNLDVELYAGANKVTGITELFDDVTLWEPGVACYETLTVKNVGTLAFKYQMSLMFDNEVKVDGHGLSEVLQIGSFAGTVAATDTRETIIDKVSNFASIATFTEEGELSANTDGAPTTYVIYWAPGENDNLYNMNNTKQGKMLSIDFGVKLVATQKTEESDSFDELYDEDAPHLTVSVADAASLKAALLKSGSYKVVLANDIPLPSDNTGAICAAIVGENSDIVLDLAGHTISRQNPGEYHSWQWWQTDTLTNFGKLTVTDSAGGGKIVSGTTDTTGAALRNYGTTVINSGIIDGNDIAYGYYTIHNMTGSVTINGGTVRNASTKSSLIAGGNSNASSDVYLSKNAALPEDQRYTTKTSAVPFAPSHTTVNGGSFENKFQIFAMKNSAVLVVNGGFFSYSGSTATGKDNSSTVTISENATFVTDATNVEQGLYATGTSYSGTDVFYISDKDGLKAFADMTNRTLVPEEFGSADTTSHIFQNKTIVLTADIDLNNEPWTPIGYSKNNAGGKALFAGIFDGNGHTIKNLFVENKTVTTTNHYLAGLFGCLSMPATVKNLTIENVKISSVSYYTGAVAGYITKTTSNITNVTVCGDIDITGPNYVGGFAGYSYAKFENCKITGNEGSKITAKSYHVGGMAAFINSGSAFTNCTVQGLTIETKGTGGAAGVAGFYADNLTVKGCNINNVAIVTTATNVGHAGTVLGYNNDTDTNPNTIEGNTVTNVTINGVAAS